MDECMTVNRIIAQYPATRMVFEDLFINTAVEGYSCLDEVAWRHGIACQELLDRLKAAIAGGMLAEGQVVENPHGESVLCV